jgi:hypothetical protein
VALERSLHNYSIADFLELRAAGRLKINEDFQRRGVWKVPARVYFIDSILRGMPIPKMYFRTEIDAKTQTGIREVVDGQQRLRAIFDFADDKLRLTKRAAEFEGLRYSDLAEEYQQAFLGYTFVAEQLINASDEQVLEVFARMNTYTVALNAAELRHAQFQGEFKWNVHEASRRWTVLWEDFGLLSIAARNRMADDALMAQMFLTVTQGVTGGESTALYRVYRHFDPSFPLGDDVNKIVDDTLTKLTERIPDAITGPLANPPHFLMMFAASAHTLHGIGRAPVDWLKRLDPLPKRPERPKTESQWNDVRDRLLEIASVVELPEAPSDSDQRRLWSNSRSRPINLVSRAVRFPYYLDAFARQ